MAVGGARHWNSLRAQGCSSERRRAKSLRQEELSRGPPFPPGGSRIILRPALQRKWSSRCVGRALGADGKCDPMLCAACEPSFHDPMHTILKNLVRPGWLAEAGLPPAAEYRMKILG